MFLYFRPKVDLFALDRITSSSKVHLSFKHQAILLRVWSRTHFDFDSGFLCSAKIRQIMDKSGTDAHRLGKVMFDEAKVLNLLSMRG